MVSPKGASQKIRANITTGCCLFACCSYDSRQMVKLPLKHPRTAMNRSHSLTQPGWGQGLKAHRGTSMHPSDAPREMSCEEEAVKAHDALNGKPLMGHLERPGVKWRIFPSDCGSIARVPKLIACGSPTTCGVNMGKRVLKTEA